MGSSARTQANDCRDPQHGQDVGHRDVESWQPERDDDHRKTSRYQRPKERQNPPIQRVARPADVRRKEKKQRTPDLGPKRSRVEEE